VQLFQDANMISLFQDEGLANWTKIRPGKVVHSKVKTWLITSHFCSKNENDFNGNKHEIHYFVETDKSSFTDYPLATRALKGCKVYGKINVLQLWLGGR